MSLIPNKFREIWVLLGMTAVIIAFAMLTTICTTTRSMADSYSIEAPSVSSLSTSAGFHYYAYEPRDLTLFEFSHAVVLCLRHHSVVSGSTIPLNIPHNMAAHFINHCKAIARRSPSYKQYVCSGIDKDAAVPEYHDYWCSNE